MSRHRLLAGIFIPAVALLGMAVPSAVQEEAEATEGAASEPLRATSIRIETVVPGSPEWVYDEITGDISDWWDHRFSEDPSRFVLEPRPGGRFLEIFDESGDGVVHAEVIYARRGERITFDGPLGFNGQPVQIVTTYELTPESGGTRLVVEVNAAGSLDEGEIDALKRVWDHFILQRFKPHIEARHPDASR